MNIKMESSIHAEELVEAIARQVVTFLRPVLARSKTSDKESLLDVKGLAQYLGVKPQWVYERVAQREVPFLKVGKFPRFRKSEIDQWLDTLKSPAMSSLSKPLKVVK